MSVVTASHTSAGPAQPPEPPAGASIARNKRRGRLRRDIVLVLLMLPGLAYFLVFHYGALAGAVVAFENYRPYLGLWDSTWVGLDNFAQIFSDGRFWHAFGNTIYMSVLELTFMFPLPLALAMLLHSLTGTTIKRFVQSVVYLPHFISWVVVVALFQQMLGGAGVLNGILSDSGLGVVDIIGNPDLFRPLVIVQVVWKEAGWATIIFLAALANVDEQQYEAAAMDGASWWRRVWHVTLPSIRPVLVLLIILRLGQILSVGFEQFFLQRNAVGPEVAEVIDTFVYYMGFEGGNFGYAAAAGLFKGVVGLILIYAANKVAHRLGEQGVYSR